MRGCLGGVGLFDSRGRWGMFTWKGGKLCQENKSYIVEALERGSSAVAGT